MKKIDIEFDFRGRHYDAAIRIDPRPSGRVFDITIRDWELERMLYGNHIIREDAGALQVNVQLANREQTELKLLIAGRLSHYLKIPCFVGDACVSEASMTEGWEELHPIPRRRHHDPREFIQ